MAEIKHLSEEQFTEFCKEGVSVIDFWAPWCGPCRMLAPILEQVAEELNEVAVGKVNVDDFPDLASAFNVHSIPNICIFKNGKLVDNVVGLRPADDLVATIKKHI